ncbi:hypothetical protein FRC11_006600, partial [Ceratobasidium sp. 423]
LRIGILQRLVESAVHDIIAAMSPLVFPFYPLLRLISLIEVDESCVLCQVSLSGVVKFLQKCRGNFSFVLRKVTVWLKSESTHHQATQLHGNHEDQMKSLALKWLIQNCETPSSISIALQAIAGASSKIPRQPLRECEATLHILRRLALNSTASPDEVESNSKLYTRALAVLGSRPQSDQERGGTEDTEVLVREFQSEHERQAVELISNTPFEPNTDNINAITLGNTATTLSLHLLKGNGQGVTETFGSIINLLLDQTNPSNRKLDLAASQSLARAAMLLAACSQAPLMSPEVVQQCIEQLVTLLLTKGRLRDQPTRPQQNNIVEPGTALLICILLRGGTEPRTTTDPHVIGGLQADRAIHLLMDKDWHNSISRDAFYHIGLLDILFNPALYGITPSTVDTDRLASNFVENYREQGLLMSSNAHQNILNDKVQGTDSAEVTDFLAAANIVYGSTALSIFQTPVPRIIPAPTYCTLVCIATLDQSMDWQNQCERLLSNSVFPRLDRGFAADYFVNRLWLTYSRTPESERASRLPSVFRPFHKADPPTRARSRHVAATQLWLLLHLAGNGDSLNEQQRALRGAIQAATRNRSEDLILLKSQLGNDIIASYRSGNHLGVYSARILECIFQDPEFLRYEHMYRFINDRIRNDLQGVPPDLRGLSSFSDNPVEPGSRQDPPDTKSASSLSEREQANDASSSRPTASAPLLIQTQPRPTVPMDPGKVGHVALAVQPGE